MTNAGDRPLAEARRNGNHPLGLAGARRDGGHRDPVAGLPDIAIASALVFVASKSLAGLLTARVIDGISVGIVASTATA